MASKLVPIGDHVLVKRVEAEGKTSGGILLPDTAKEKPQEGIVQAVGDGRMLKNGETVDFQVKKGDRIIFTSYAGTEVKLGEVEYMVMSEEEILAKIT